MQKMLWGLVESLFREKPGEWFHHYAMLNTRTYRPLLNHWHLYYIELKKFIKAFEQKGAGGKLEQGSLFLWTGKTN
jgi:hypothetical protein